MSFVGFGNVLLNGLGVDLKFLFKKRKRKKNTYLKVIILHFSF